MAVNQTSSRWKLLLAAGVSVLALACGDDSGDGGGSTNSTTPTLDKGVVGKACAADTDCGKGGVCSKTQSIGGLNSILTAIGVDTSIAAPDGYCSTACTSNEACGEGGVCFGSLGTLVPGECRKSCTAPTDCRNGYECAKLATTADGGVVGGTLVQGQLPSQCQALPATPALGANQAGAACSDAADAGTALNNACKPGTCALGACTATCVNDSTCGAGAACVPNGVYGATGSCQETCNVDTDCNQYTADGTVGCVDVNGTKLCTLKQYPLEAGKLGSACTENAACGRGGSCATTLGGGFNPTPAPGGYCTLNGCQDDTVCTGGVCVNGGALLGTRCFDSCTVDGECRTGYSCQERPTTANVTAKVCTPSGAATDAGTGSSARVVGGLDGGV